MGERIGPCTFNAIFSTFLAVVVVGFSDSYIFRVFFKVLFLVTVLAGGHGLVLLPVILSVLGGDDTSPEVEHSDSWRSRGSHSPRKSPSVRSVAVEDKVAMPLDTPQKPSLSKDT